MNRKTTTILPTVLVAALAVTLGGCPKKKPEMPPPEMPVEQTTVAPTPPVAQEVKPPKDMTQGDATANQLPKDIEELNRVLRERGLIDDVYFDYNLSDLRSDAQSRLARNAEWLRSNPGYVALIEGHCDERGTNEYNLNLGQKRADEAIAYLVSLGVSAQRLTSLTLGEEKPVCTEPNEACWQRNRRAHFVVKPK